ncbi:MULTISPECIES: hypothetical protein [Nostocales]|uniref:Uncharacterized protein n=3 Tax=Nostocales TaxID=1161 RepID=A0A0C1RFB3_9CYAN|nr:hypothetical protein [Tolypothrix bouteillei]KAF3886868.1 hypothetical protein DA73_0400016275 [Tolypothrix bouteillei VB521301]
MHIRDRCPELGARFDFHIALGVRAIIALYMVQSYYSSVKCYASQAKVASSFRVVCDNRLAFVLEVMHDNQLKSFLI